MVLGIRPECIAEGERGFAGSMEAPVVVSAPVEMIEPTGAETIVLFAAVIIGGRGNWFLPDRRSRNEITDPARRLPCAIHYIGC